MSCFYDQMMGNGTPTNGYILSWRTMNSSVTSSPVQPDLPSRDFPSLMGSSQNRKKVLRESST